MGNALYTLVAVSIAAVHPHRRGERPFIHQIRNDRRGSSPQAWGTHNRKQRPRKNRRFIPTGVGNASSASLRVTPASVHPHRRGERRSGIRRYTRRSGSSPQAWGTPQQTGRPVRTPRFIPTGVGNASRDRSSSMPPPVHPHRRGERRQGVPVWGKTVGSSPQAWGTLYTQPVCRLMARFIPTGVGNAHRFRSVPGGGTVHPHRRGERGEDGDAALAGGGSSPQAWGTHDFDKKPGEGFRFIPTGVGNALHHLFDCVFLPVHPHRRGERAFGAIRDEEAGGSSPQAWGTRDTNRIHRIKSRFIPTGVGNAPVHFYLVVVQSVHPHRRGERWSSSKSDSTARGSSPQAWGTRGCQACHRLDGRFIPTGVGNAFRSINLAFPEPVHPHRRGERLGPTKTAGSRRGSSPQAWGTHAVAQGGQAGGRFIPTGVGNARSSGVRGLQACGSSPQAWGTPGRPRRRPAMPRFIPTGVGNAL